MRASAKLLACWLLSATVPATAARAAETWRDELEQVCSRTQDAMSLSSDELRSLVARCDELKRPIAGLEESERKVFSRRLQLCRDLYEFVLQSRGQG